MVFGEEKTHWAFKPVANPKPPKVHDKVWPLGDLDRFILNRLEQKGLRPVAESDRFTWRRRVSFDLTGLPPTVEEIRVFEADQSPQAREKVVDRLLASQAFGERWARHWLDLVGYADQIGTSNNVFAEHAWRYRDYVIDAYNNDKPFDRFIREQIAGDLLPHKTVEERAANLVATGFLVLGDIEIVEADKAKVACGHRRSATPENGQGVPWHVDWLRAAATTTSLIPSHRAIITRWPDFFRGTSTVYKTKRGVWSDVNVIELPETEAQKAERDKHEKAHADRLAKLKGEREAARKRKAELDDQLKKKDLPKEERGKLTKERDEKAGCIVKLDKEITHAEFFAPSVPRAHGVRDVEKPGDMKITIRGNPRALGKVVPRGFLHVASSARPEIPRDQSGRRELADWVAGRDNPLTARVAVNRTWQKLFGEGLVRTVDYFGLPGERPSHPALLDFLADRFMRESWSQKRLIRSLVLSRTYRLSSTHDERNHATDPDNRLLWRMNRFRLDAEALRDAMIFTSGKLKPTTGGPALPLEFQENVNNIDPKNVNPPSFSLRKWRPGQEFERTIYLPIIRSAAQPGPAELRNVFDFAQPSEFTGQRAITAVPTQALFLMNSPEVKKHVAALAARMKKETADDAKRLEYLWLSLLNRPITAQEQREAAAFLKQAGEGAWSELCHALLASNEFLMRL